MEFAPAWTAAVDRHALFERLNAHGISQNEAARRAGISSGHLSRIVNGLRDPSPGVFLRFAPHRSAMHASISARRPADDQPHQIRRKPRGNNVPKPRLNDTCVQYPCRLEARDLAPCPPRFGGCVHSAREEVLRNIVRSSQRTGSLARWFKNSAPRSGARDAGPYRGLLKWRGHLQLEHRSADRRRSGSRSEGNGQRRQKRSISGSGVYAEHGFRTWNRDHLPAPFQGASATLGLRGRVRQLFRDWLGRTIDRRYLKAGSQLISRGSSGLVSDAPYVTSGSHTVFATPLDRWSCQKGVRFVERSGAAAKKTVTTDLCALPRFVNRDE